MEFEFEWTDLVDGESDIEVEPINLLAKGIQETQEAVKKIESAEQPTEQPTKLSQLENDMGFVKASDLCAVFTFSDYLHFYSGIAGSYVDTTNWLDGQIIRIKDSAVPLLYVQKKRSDGNIPTTEEECIALLETHGYISNSVVTFRKYSEILGGDFGDVSSALDGIIAIQNSLMEDDAS